MKEKLSHGNRRWTSRSGRTPAKMMPDSWRSILNAELEADGVPNRESEGDDYLVGSQSQPEASTPRAM